MKQFLGLAVGFVMLAFDAGVVVGGTLLLIWLAEWADRALEAAGRVLRRRRTYPGGEHAATAPVDTCGPTAGPPRGCAAVADDISADADLLMREIHAYLEEQTR